MAGAFEETWRRRFENFARHHDDDAGIAGWSASGLAARLRAFERAFGAERRIDGQLWADVGCGAGTYSRWLARRGAEVLGLDYSQPSLTKALHAAPAPALSWAAADANALPLPTARFDGALCFGVLQALSAPDAAVGELCRILKPGAELWIDALNIRSAAARAQQAQERRRGEPGRLRRDDPAALCAMLERAGLVEVRLNWVPIAPARWQAVQGLLESAPMRAVWAAAPSLGALASHSMLVSGRLPAAAP